MSASITDFPESSQIALECFDSQLFEMRAYQPFIPVPDKTVIKDFKITEWKNSVNLPPG